MSKKCPVCNGNKKVPCGICGGTGKRTPSNPCYFCDGKKTVDCPRCNGTGEA